MASVGSEVSCVCFVQVFWVKHLQFRQQDKQTQH